MTTDIRLDEHGGDWVEVDAAALRIRGADLIIDDPRRRRADGLRRALVHDQGDGLTINIEGDYPGGVTIDGDLRLTGALLAGGTQADVVTSLRTEIADLRSQLGPVTVDRLDRLDRTIASLAALLDAVIVPEWLTKEEVEHGDDLGLRSPSAADLGLVVIWDVLQADPRYGHEELVGIDPEPGTALRRGSTVRITINLAG